MIPSHFHLHHKIPEYAGLVMRQSAMAHLYMQTILSYSYCYNHFHLSFCPHASSTYWRLQSITFMAWNSASELYAKWYWQDYLLKCNILKSKSSKKFKVREQTKSGSMQTPARDTFTNGDSALTTEVLQIYKWSFLKIPNGHQTTETVNPAVSCIQTCNHKRNPMSWLDLI